MGFLKFKFKFKFIYLNLGELEKILGREMKFIFRFYFVEIQVKRKKGEVFYREEVGV